MIVIMYFVLQVQRRSHLPAPRDNVYEMKGSAVLQESVELQYDQNLLLEIDVCYDKSITTPVLKTSLLARSGTFTHYVCDDAQCSPDSSRVKCSSASPMPVESCVAQFTPNLPKAFVYIHAAGGRLLPNNTYMAEFKFGATFDSR